MGSEQTNLTSFLIDAFCFLEEKLNEARADQLSQMGAMSEAAGYARCIRRRLNEDSGALTMVMLVWDETKVAPEWWLRQAKADRSQFMDDSSEALEKVIALRELFRKKGER